MINAESQIFSHSHPFCEKKILLSLKWAIPSLLWTYLLLQMGVQSKSNNRMANSVDPDDSSL